MVLVGDDPASAVYVSHKEKGCEEVGFHHVTHRLPADTPQDRLLALIGELNADPAIDGILVQLPLPAHLDQETVLLAVDPRKDVDGFHPENLGRLVAGAPRFVPCTPKGILRLLEHYDGAGVRAHRGGGRAQRDRGPAPEPAHVPEGGHGRRHGDHVPLAHARTCRG